MSENDNLLPRVELKVFPDTGHQYLFVPFKSEFLSRYDREGKIKRLCSADRQPWVQYTGVEKDGKTPHTYTWIRHRYGVNADGAPGIWLVVETNVGTVRRGALYEKREVPFTDVPPSKDDWAVSPYAYPNQESLANKADKDSYDVLLTIPNPSELDEILQVALIEVIWQRRNPARMDVDLIVDFGNTRTVVLAVENNAAMAKDKLSGVCRPIPFLARGEECPVPGSPEMKKVKTIADSWFLLQEPAFSEMDMRCFGAEKKFCPSREYTEEQTTVTKDGWGGLVTTKETKTLYYLTERLPQMFSEVSPVIMGDEACELLAGINLNDGQNLSMSSPKRYLWDDAPCGGANNGMAGLSPWCMNPNRWSDATRRDTQMYLAGQICRFMYPDGRDWDIEHPPYEAELSKRPTPQPLTPTYPRSSAMVWSALHIIESAYRQISSANWRKGNDEWTSRRLRSVNVTYPSGWIAKERKAYERAWKQAVDIFTLAHFDTRKDVNANDGLDGRPLLSVELDEAVASQLPFIHSEVRRLNSANTWIRLYGRPHAGGQETQHHVRVMTIDIGGGTMDTSIVEYRNTVPGNQVSLRYKVLFRDCSTFAGDKVMLNIIQRVLLPSILQAKGIEDEEDDVAQKFTEVLGQQHNTHSARAKWQRITKMVFMPIVRQWLTDVATLPQGIYADADGSQFRTIQQYIDESGVEEGAVAEFNEYLQREGELDEGFVDPDDRLVYSPELVNACIQESLDYGISPLAKFVSAYDVDIVTLSGKISEMPTVVELLRDTLPICSQRIVRMKDYMAGDWYPMSADKRINDAKTVTAVGAALYKAGSNGLVNNWMLRRDTPTDAEAMRNFWGVISAAGDFGDNEPFLSNRQMDNAKNTFTVDGVTFHGANIVVGSYIGRQKYNVRNASVEQQYQLKWIGKNADGAPRPAPASLAVIFERVNDGEDDDIVIRDVRAINAADDGTVSVSDVELQLCTLPAGGFWMDECRFEVEMDNSDIL